MNPRNISISDFTYELPDNKIAKYPLEKRDESKLLVYKDNTIKDSIYKEIATEIPENSWLIFNNTKVVEARLFFNKETGGQIEIFCLEPEDQYKDITTAMLQKEKVWWKCLVGGAKKWKDEQIIFQHIKHEQSDLKIEAKKIKKENDYFIIEFTWNKAELSFAEILHIAGQIPLPPYLHRDVEEKDKQTYQTVYAKHDGSVAAPTAGLHFTENIFNSFVSKNINTEYVTLHVGAGTFKPVKASTMQEHDMHSEFIDVNLQTIQNIYKHLHNKIIVVGTTSLRTVESLYWIGVKIKVMSEHGFQDITSHQFKSEILEINQWDCYDLPQHITKEIALKTLIEFLEKNNLKKLITKTQILIAPGYELRIADGLITNFHQPNSTLLLLISSIVGDAWKKIYTHAIENNYRFLSYGDGSLLWKH